MLDAFFFEAFEEEAVLMKEFLPETVSAEFTPATIQEYDAETPPARIISIRTQSQIPLTWANSMEALLSRSTGYDHLRKYCRDTGKTLPCGYLPEYCARAVAEQAMLLWTALLRRLPDQIKSFRSFTRDGLTGNEIEGKCLLVVGVGKIGYQVTQIGKGLGMRVLGNDLEKQHGDVDYVDIDSGLAQADIVVCAMNLNETNSAFFSYERLKGIKPGACFVNIARGEMAPPSVLSQCLEEKKLSGVGLDVYDAESDLAIALRGGPPSERPEVQATLHLADQPNVILTPHNAFNTWESVERKARQTIEQINHFLKIGTWIWGAPMD